MKTDQLTGQSEAHLAEIFPGYSLHEQVIAPYRALVDLATASSFDLRLASGFRSFDRQLAIWNAKASGARSVLDDNGEPVALAELSDIELVRAILRWSALPGSSRHHWGTDVDIWDATAVDTGYQPQLLSEEYTTGGVFFRLTLWLDELIASGTCGFYRPYELDRGGVAPEPWHLSYRPLAERFEQLMDRACLRKVLEQTDILLKQAILDNFDEVYERYVCIGIESRS
jgi:LAS superfamily LD-carboxypeptidase LdcB